MDRDALTEALAKIEALEIELASAYSDQVELQEDIDARDHLLEVARGQLALAMADRTYQL